MEQNKGQDCNVCSGINGNHDDRCGAAVRCEAVADHKTRGLLMESLGWIESSSEPAPSLCADIRKYLGLPVSARAAVRGEAVVDVAEVDKHLDAVLRASGSALHYFSMQKVIGAMRNAMIEAMRSNAVQVSARAADAPSETSELATQAMYGMHWPEGYVVDLNGKITPPKGRVNDFNFGYDNGYADGLQSIKDTVANIGAQAVAKSRAADTPSELSELDGWNKAANALSERAAGHFRNKDYDLQDECLQCAAMLHDLKPARPTAVKSRAADALDSQPTEPASNDVVKIAVAALKEVSEWRFGWDGDCGVTAVADAALGAIEGALASNQPTDDRCAECGLHCKAGACIYSQPTDGGVRNG